MRSATRWLGTVTFGFADTLAQQVTQGQEGPSSADPSAAVHQDPLVARLRDKFPNHFQHLFDGRDVLWETVVGPAGVVELDHLATGWTL